MSNLNNIQQLNPNIRIPSVNLLLNEDFNNNVRKLTNFSFVNSGEQIVDSLKNTLKPVTEIEPSVNMSVVVPEIRRQKIKQIFNLNKIKDVNGVNLNKISSISNVISDDYINKFQIPEINNVIINNQQNSISENVGLNSKNTLIEETNILRNVYKEIFDTFPENDPEFTNNSVLLDGTIRQMGIPENIVTNISNVVMASRNNDGGELLSLLSDSPEYQSKIETDINSSRVVPSNVNNLPSLQNKSRNNVEEKIPQQKNKNTTTNAAQITNNDKTNNELNDLLNLKRNTFEKNENVGMSVPPSKISETTPNTLSSIKNNVENLNGLSTIKSGMAENVSVSNFTTKNKSTDNILNRNIATTTSNNINEFLSTANITKNSSTVILPVSNKTNVNHNISNTPRNKNIDGGEIKLNNSNINSIEGTFNTSSKGTSLIDNSDNSAVNNKNVSSDKLNINNIPNIETNELYLKNSNNSENSNYSLNSPSVTQHSTNISSVSTTMIPATYSHTNGQSTSNVNKQQISASMSKNNKIDTIEKMPATTVIKNYGKPPPAISIKNTFSMENNAIENNNMNRNYLNSIEEKTVNINEIPNLSMEMTPQNESMVFNIPEPRYVPPSPAIGKTN